MIAEGKVFPCQTYTVSFRFVSASAYQSENFNFNTLKNTFCARVIARVQCVCCATRNRSNDWMTNACATCNNAVVLATTFRSNNSSSSNKTRRLLLCPFVSRRWKFHRNESTADTYPAGDFLPRTQWDLAHSFHFKWILRSKYKNGVRGPFVAIFESNNKRILICSTPKWKVGVRTSCSSA